MNCDAVFAKPWLIDGKHVSYLCGGNCGGWGQPLCNETAEPQLACGSNIGCPGADHSFTLVQGLKTQD